MDDLYYMNFAIQLAQATLGQTAMNPSVGAVVVKNNHILGIGAHLAAGSLHAEIYALNMAGINSHGATLYVTLEPCAHHGKTPPCIDAIIDSHIKRVVIAVVDPNPLVAGKGIAKLKQAGIEVVVGVLAAEALLLNQVFFHNIQSQVPFITLKCAMSLDAKLATVTNESKWITNEKSRADAHIYRHQHDAILVGVNTIIADNPALTTRLKGGGKHPIRIILDTSLRTPLTSQIIIDKEVQTWIVVGNKIDLAKIQQYKAYGIKIIQMDSVVIQINELLPRLFQLGITSILVEGGNKVHTSFLNAKLFNQLILYISPLLIGGAGAPTFFAGAGFNRLKDALALDLFSVEKVADDLKIIAKPKNYKG